MKKLLSLFLALVILLACAFPAVSLAEALTEAQQLELASALEWMMKDLSEEDYLQVFSWDRSAILEKLADYDQPLETLTREEIADQLVPVFSMLGFFVSMANSEDGGEALMEMFGGLMGGDGSSSFLSGEWNEEEDDDSEEDYGDSEENAEPDYSFYYSGVIWESGDLTLESVWQDDYYKIAILDGETEYAYLCELDAATGIAAGIGTGDLETAETQPDHGIAAFRITEDEHLIWQKADGGEVAFTRYVSPLSGLSGYADGKDLSVTWMGNCLEVIVQRDDDVWFYTCELNEETDTLEGSGYLANMETGETVEGYYASFAFRNGRTQAVWTDGQVPEARDGLTFEMYEPLLACDYWTAEEADMYLFKTSGYYQIRIYTHPDFTEYGYLCTYERADRTLNALDPAAVDFEALGLDYTKEIFTTTASFVLEDDGRLVWRDDTGAAGDGVVFEPVF